MQEVMIKIKILNEITQQPYLPDMNFLLAVMSCFNKRKHNISVRGKIKSDMGNHDIYKDERIPKSVDNQCFNSFKINNIYPNNAFYKFEK